MSLFIEPVKHGGGGVKSPAIGHMTKTSDTNIQCKPRLIQDKELTNNRQVIHITLAWVS